jgi:hypothetical protein
VSKEDSALGKWISAVAALDNILMTEIATDAQKAGWC